MVLSRSGRGGAASLSLMVALGQLVLGGCFFDSSGLPPSAPPSLDVTVELAVGSDQRADRALPPDAGRDQAPSAADIVIPDGTGCPAGQLRCGKTCVNPRNDAKHCGKCNKACPGDAICAGAVCCPAGWKNCGGKCTNTGGDPKHCGGCNKACAAGKACSTGKCCKTGFKNCAGTCTNVGSDKENCGVCGTKCAAGKLCMWGKCCASSQRNCGNKCTNIAKDNNNCGACGAKCTGGRSCTSGLCCPPGQVNCTKKCTVTATDKANCGACGKACKAHEQCDQARCCAQGLKNCGGKCVDLATDNSNCGVCGTKCTSGKVCAAGKCAGATGCKDGSVEQIFGGGMVGCSGKVYFPQRHGLCQPGFAVCGANQWVAQHGATAPKFAYWTNNNLRYIGPRSSCFVSKSHGTYCGQFSPMRVCAGPGDPLGNGCNWYNCGYGTPTPNHYFGGCQYNYTAGALCCPAP